MNTAAGLPSETCSSAPQSDPFITRIAAEHGDDLVRFLSRRTRRVVDARDLAQEVYVRLLRLQRKDLIQNPKGYIFRVAVNLLHEFNLKAQAESVGIQAWGEEAVHRSGDKTPEQIVNAAGIGSRLRKVLNELTPKCRTVIVLHRLEGMTYDEIGAELNISASMVKKYLGIGLAHCRKRLQDVEAAEFTERALFYKRGRRVVSAV